MKKSLFMVLTLLIMGRVSMAQEISNDELLPDESGADQLELSAYEYGDGSKSTTASALSLRKYCPTVRSQAGLPTGVRLGLVFGYYSMTILKGRQYQWSAAQIEKEAFSAFFPFESLPKNETNCQIGKDFLKAMETVLTGIGNVKAAAYDRSSVNCHNHPVDRWRQQAARHQIDRLERVFDNRDADARKELRSKQSIQAGRPVVAIMLIDRGFMQLGGDTWRRNDELLYERPTWQPVVVVGYDDKRRAFEIVNCMGSSWGNGGFAWVSYEDFARRVGVAVQLIDHPDEKVLPRPVPAPIANVPVIRQKPSIRLHGDGTMQLIKATSDSTYQTSPIAVLRRGNYYETQSGFAVNDQMRFVSGQLPRFGYVYIFSIDPNQKAEVHFPTAGESAYVVDDEARLVFPRPRADYDQNGRIILHERGFSKEVKGADWLVILYSKDALSTSQLTNWMSQLAVPSESVMAILERVLGNRMVPWKSVAFEPKAMKFSVTSSAGDIVPLVLKINGN
ncbi:hypothetical protein [Spirosoma litoris]